MPTLPNRHVTWAIGLLVLSLGCLCFALATKAGRNGERKVEAKSKAATLRSKELLKIPIGMDSKRFIIAKSAPNLEVCFFAGLDDSKKGTLWSSWGDGLVASNGKYYTSLGDHLGEDARSYVYEYDPAHRFMCRVVDVLREIAHVLGLYGHGKIHSGIHEGADGWLYFATYWGKHRQINAAFKKGYKGSILMRYHPQTGKVENLGPIAPFKGLPTSAFDKQRHLLYFLAVSKKNPKDSYTDHLVVFDIKSKKVKFSGGSKRINGRRALLVGKNGRVYFSSVDGTLDYYDPKSNTLGRTKAKLPKSAESRKGDTLRAAAGPTRKGVLFGMTAAGQLFSFDPKSESVKDLGPNFLYGDYTAVMALSPDEKYIYFAPGAHGSGNRTGAPVVQYDIATGKRKVLAFLRDALRDKLKYNIGGTYNLKVDTKGKRLFITFNGAPNAGRRPRTFGKPCVVVLHIPAAER